MSHEKHAMQKMDGAPEVGQARGLKRWSTPELTELGAGQTASGSVESKVEGGPQRAPSYYVLS